MGSCYSNLAAAHQFFIQQQEQEQQEQQQEPQSLSFINENNNLIVEDKSPIVDFQQSPKIDSKIEKLSKHTIHSQNPSLKLINKTPKSCDPKVIGEIDEHQKCLDYSYKKKTNRRKKRSSSSSSCSTNRNNSLPSTPSKQQLSSPSKKHKKKRQLFRRIRETILNNKRTTNFTVKHQSRADDNHTQKSYVDDKKPIEETLINTYQVSFVPATSELFEIVCVSSDQSDEDESRENDRNDRKQVALFARIKNRFSLRNIANLTKSGKGKNNNNTNTNQRKEKDSHAPKENYLDEDDDYEREKHSNLRRNEDKMSYLKNPFRSNVQSMVNSNNNDNNGNNNGTTTAAAAASGGKIISSGFVRKKTEQFQTLYNEMDNLQKFSNMPTLEAKSTNNDNNCQQKSNKKNENNLDRAQPHQPSKLLPPTNVVTSTSNSIFRGLRSRIPSMIAKSTGNVNGALHQSSNQQQQPRFIKNANIRGTKTAATAAPASSSTTTTTTATTNLIKPISAPTLSSSCCSSSSSSSSTSSLNQPIRPPIFKAQNSSKSLKQQQKKLSTNLKPPTATVVPSQHAQTMVRKSSSSSNLLSTENPPVAPALPPKPLTAITQTKTVLSIEPKQAQIVSMATKTSAQQQQQESRLNPTSGLAPPDMNRIGIPIMKPSFGGTIPPALSTQTSQRQQQRLNFLYGIQPTSPVHPIVPRIFGSQPQPQPLPQPVPAINKSSLMFNNNINNHNSIAQHYQRDNNNKYPSKGEHSMMTSRIKTNHASSNHPETTSLAYMPYSRQQPAMKKSTLPTTNGNPMIPSMANRNKPSLLYNKAQQQYSVNSRQNNNRNNLTFSKANYNNNNNNNANQSYRKNTEDLNGNFLSKPNPSMAHTTATTTTGTLEEFFVAKNFSRNQYLSLVGKEISPIIGTDSTTMTKRRMVNNDDHDDGDHNSLTPQMIKQHQFNDALILSQSDSDHPKTDGTFSACSSMVEDEDEDGLSTCSVRTEDFLPNKQTQDRGNINQISSMMSSGSTGSNPCSASICSTASTTSSFVFDPNRGSRNGHSHQPRPRFHTGSTSTSSCSNRDLFLIDDEIADQPALMISGDGNQSTIEEQRLQSILNLSDLVDEKNWIMSPTKTLTPSSTSNTVTTVSSNNDSPVTNHHHQTSSSNTMTPSCELMLQSLNHELDNLILQTNIDYQSLPPNNGDNITDPNGTGKVPVPMSNSSQPIQNTAKAANTRIDRIGSSCKLRKRHSYTSSSSSSNSTSPGNAHHHHHVPVVFRRPRPLSFVENDDGSFGLDTPSLRAVAQDLIGIKTLLFRLQNVLQNAETQNPFGPVVDRPSPRSSSYEWSDKVAIGSESNHDQQSLMQMLREEIFDLKQHNQLLEQQMIEKDRTIRLLQQQMAKYTTNGNIIEPSSARRQNTMVDYRGGVGDGCSSCSCSNHINNNHNNNNNNADFGAKQPSTIELMNSTTQTEPRDYNYHPRMSTVTNTAAANLTAVGQDSLNNNNLDNVSDSVKC